jgi:hypothetical protein
MEVLLGNGFDANDPAHWVPEQVARLEEYPPYDLTPHLQEQLSVEYTAGQTDTVRLLSQSLLIACYCGVRCFCS